MNKHQTPDMYDQIGQLIFERDKSRPYAHDIRGERMFPWDVKQKCWEKSMPVYGRDPDRWRMDPFGNPVLRELRGCPGQFCHEYDHIVPYSKGGHSVLENCQILQTGVNRLKSNRTNVTFAELRAKSPTQVFDEKHMDLVESLVYGSLSLPSKSSNQK